MESASQWLFLLAAYASHLDSGRHLSCPKHRALHSILYAALRRGRPYLSVSSGAAEFFNEASQAIESGLNPLFDSVLENSVRFRPELQMLDRELEAYRRDLARARKSIVHLPRWSAPFQETFATLQRTPLLANGSIRPEHLAEAGRLQADGIYLRDPECLLFKEWARTDTETPSMRRGFLFTAVAYSNGRPQAIANTSDYFFAIDPERAGGHHLYPVWARLQAAEVKAVRANPELCDRLEAAERSSRDTSQRTTCRIGFEHRAGLDTALFDDPWFDGNNFECTIIATPNRGTLIGEAGSRGDLLGDPVADIVRLELEHSIFLADSPSGAVSALIRDFPAQPGPLSGREPDPVSVALDSPPPSIEPGHFRFGRLPLHRDVDLFSGGVAGQIGAILWGVLDPVGNEGVPAEILNQHLIVARGSLTVWSRRGLMIAYKPECKDYAAGLEHQFGELVRLSRDVIDFADREERPRPADLNRAAEMTASAEEHRGAARADEAYRLTRQVARTRFELTLPENRPLAKFFEATGIGKLLESVHDLNITATEQHTNQRLEKNTHIVAHVQTNLEWLEIIIVSVYATELAEYFARESKLFGGYEIAFVFGVALTVGLFTALLLKPWTLSPSPWPVIVRPIIMMIVVALTLAAGIAFNLYGAGHTQPNPPAAAEHSG